MPTLPLGGLRLGATLALLLAGAAGCPQSEALAPAATQLTAPAPREADMKPPEEAKAHELSLSFVGDIIFGRYRAGEGFDPIVEGAARHPFDDVRHLLAADVVVGNLETPVVEALSPTSPIGARYRFGGSRAMVRDYLGDFSVLSLANNHYFDLRAQGQRDTPRILREEGLFPVGGARIDGPLHRVERYEARGWKLAFLGVTNRINARPRPDGPRVPYIKLRDMPALLLPLVAAARAEHDLVILLVHWGDEYLDAPTDQQRAVAHALIEGGVDLIIGHHPHVLQAIERHRGGLIAYSLGNFLFENTGPQPRLTGVLRTTWRAPTPARPAPCLGDATFLPAVNVRAPYPHPEPATGEIAKRVRHRLARLSEAEGSAWAPAAEGGEALQLEGLRCEDEAAGALQAL